jgi:hypothetical protein
MRVINVFARTLFSVCFRQVIVAASILAKAALVGANTVKAVSVASVERVVTRSAAVRSSTSVLNWASPVAMVTTLRWVDGGSKTPPMECTTPLLACTIPVSATSTFLAHSSTHGQIKGSWFSSP